MTLDAARLRPYRVQIYVDVVVPSLSPNEGRLAAEKWKDSIDTHGVVLGLPPVPSNWRIAAAGAEVNLSTVHFDFPNGRENDPYTGDLIDRNGVTS